jgi:tetratricopeptide (TPR) repeat protein
MFGLTGLQVASIAAGTAIAGGALILGRMILRNRDGGAHDGSDLSAAMKFENKVMRYFSDNGWRVGRTELGSFFAHRAGLYLYILSGHHLVDYRFNPTSRSFLRRVQSVRTGANVPGRPTVLAVLPDRENAAYYTGISDGWAAVLAWEDIDYINALNFNTLLTAHTDPASLWALSVVENNQELCYKLSKAEARRGDPAAARRWAERAVALDKGYGDGHYQLSGLQLQSGELDAAQESARRAEDLGAPRSAVLRRLSEIESRRGDAALAMKLIHEAITADNYDAPNYHHLAWLHMKLQDYRAAEQAEQSAVALDPNNPFFAKRMEEIEKNLAASGR